MMIGEVATTQSTLARPAPDAPARSKMAWLGLAATLAFAIFILKNKSFGGFAGVHQVFAWATLALLALLYWRGYVLLNSAGAGALRTVIAFGVVFALLGLVSPPFDSPDLYAYANYGWLQHHYHLNPYTRLVSETAGWQHDPMIAGGWANTPCVYGFLFALLARVIAWAGGGELGLTIFLFKLVAVAAFGATGFLIWAIGTRIGLARVDLALYLYLWNPLIIFHELANGHNDLEMAMFVMLAIWFAAVEFPILTIPALIAGTMIKPFAVVILPFAFLYTLRRAGLLRASAGVILGAALWSLAALPYLADWTSLPIRTSIETFHSPNYSLASVAYEAVYAINNFYPLGAFFRFARGASLLVFLLGAGLLIVARLIFFAGRRPEIQDLIAEAVLAEMILILLALNLFYPWHLAAFLPTALLLAPGHWLRHLAIALSMTWLLYFTEGLPLQIINTLIMTALPMVWVAIRDWNDVRNGLTGHWASTTAAQE
jgi:hypothetical protein